MHSTAAYLQHHTDRTARLRRAARPRRDGRGAPDRRSHSTLLAALRPTAARPPVVGAAC